MRTRKRIIRLREHRAPAYEQVLLADLPVEDLDPEPDQACWTCTHWSTGDVDRFRASVGRCINDTSNMYGEACARGDACSDYDRFLTARDSIGGEEDAKCGLCVHWNRTGINRDHKGIGVCRNSHVGFFNHDRTETQKCRGFKETL